MNRLFVVGCAGCLALGLALSSSSQGGCSEDTDGDGVCDPVDNCTLVANGNGFAQGGSCDDQEDGDGDGYGNPCDTDVNNDGATGMDDVLATLQAVRIAVANENFDFNCDGGAGLDDTIRVLVDAKAVAVPGPSGYACAGTVSCP